MSDYFAITAARYAVLRALEDVVSARKSSCSAHVKIDIRTGVCTITLSTWTNLFGYKTEYHVKVSSPLEFDAALDKLVAEVAGE